MCPQASGRPPNPATITEDQADLRLVAQMRDDDERAIAELIRRHSGRVQLIIWRIIEGYGNWDDVEDLAQDVTVRCWEEASSFDPNRGTVKKWINTLAKFAALDFRRKAIRAPKIRQYFEGIEKAIQEDPLTVGFLKAEKEQRERVLKVALDKLSERELSPIRLHYYEGKTYKQVAEILNCPEATAKSRVRRALQKLKLLIYLD